jgi:predicted TIM-barrel fold metal-dependent hydrolase
MSPNPLVPDGAWETHIHAFDPEKFPYAIPRSYTPKPAAIGDYPFSLTGCKNIVIVHASIQGSSPAPLVDTLSKQKNLPGVRLRGLATIDVNNITDAELDVLHEAGVRGARLHEMAWGHGHQSGGDAIIKKVRALGERLARLEWAIGIFCDIRAWASMAEFIRTELDPRIKLTADHLGGTFPGEESLPEFETFLELIREKRIYVKLSGFERLYHGHAGGIETVTPIAKAIIAAGPDRIVFGTGNYSSMFVIVMKFT